MPKKTSGDLTSIFSDYSPTVMSNGQIRMECPFRENHMDGGGRMSFFISPDKNAYHCFSCNCHGNLLRLLTTKFRVNYFEAVGMVRLTDYTPTKKEFELDVMWDVKKFPKEFIKRGYTEDTLSHFRVGTTSDGNILIPYYSDFSKPIELIGYQERWYYPERGVKNSKGFNKREYLYNLDYSYPYVILVEGQSDVWRLYQFGFNACALMGADISEWQVLALSKFKRVYLALDNDLAGRKGTEICNYFLKNHTEIMLIPYTTKDPGECKSLRAWSKFFAKATDYVEYSMEMSMEWEEYLDMRDEVISEVKRR